MSQPSSSRLNAFISACSAALLRHRFTLLWLFLAATVALGYSATRLRLDPGFAKTVPLQHPYMQTYTEFARQFGDCGLGHRLLRVSRSSSLAASSAQNRGG